MFSPITIEYLESRRLFAAAITVLAQDDFSSRRLDASLWHLPAWSPDGSTFLGRTQLRVSQNAAAPKVSGGVVHFSLDTYNPTALPGQPSFYGTELISNQEYEVGTGLDVVIRAKLNSPTVGGIVGGLFLYAVKPGGAAHDEIDTELLSTNLRRVQSNVYADEPLGAGSPQFSTLARGNDLTAYHTYEMTVTPTQVAWYVDGWLVRTERAKVPTGPMRVYLNLWAPAAEWAQAYNASLQPTARAKYSQRFEMDIDSVAIRRVRARGTSAGAVATPAAMRPQPISPIKQMGKEDVWDD